MVSTTVKAHAIRATWLHRLALPQWKPVADAFVSGGISASLRDATLCEARTRFVRSRTTIAPFGVSLVFATTSFSADYVHVFARKQFMTFDENKGTRTTTASTSPIVRPDPTVQAVNTFVNVGETDYDALLLQVERRLSRGFSARV